MLQGNLCDYVGRQVMRKSDAMRGKITALQAATEDINGDGIVDENDMVFEITLNDKSVTYIAARSKTIENGDFKLL